jgi:broad specificity phosphatase PhoE/predicted kinase
LLGVEQAKVHAIAYRPGRHPSTPEPPLDDSRSPTGDRLVVVMVGLPARGKTYTARKLARYLRWQDREARVFNVGAYRRERIGAAQSAEFFDPDNPEGAAARRAMAEAALEDLLSWLDRTGEVAIYDATNSTRERRMWVRQRCEARGARVLFVETVCNDSAVIESNIRETKLHSPDYRGIDPEEAVRDFRRRIANYEKKYEPVLEEDVSFVRIIDAGRQLMTNNIQGYLPSRLVTFLMNLHLAPRTIYLTRHGQSAFNAEERVGGNPELTEAGRHYGTALGTWLDERGLPDLVIWHSTLRRAVETASLLGRKARAFKILDEIDAGIYDGWTYDEIARRAPAEAAARSADKLRYRYPGGESYLDVIRRLDPILVELERQRRPVLIIAHNAVIRALYGYFADEPAEAVPRIPIPLHTVLELTPRAYGLEEARHPLA